MIKLEEKLSKEFKVMPNKFVKINSEYYIGGENNLFINKTLKQTQFIIFCLCLCDNRIQVKKELLKDTEYMPNFVALEISREDLKVFRFLYGKHIKEFVDLDKDFNIKSKEGEYLFFSMYKEDTIHIFLNTKVIKYEENKTYTNVWVGDALLTKKRSSLYIKMKWYSFLDIQAYVEDRGEINSEDRLNIYFSKEEYNLWANCDHRITESLVSSLKSINSENNKNIQGSYEIKNNIKISMKLKSVADHIKENGEIATSKYKGTSRKKSVKGEI